MWLRSGHMGASANAILTIYLLEKRDGVAEFWNW
jgi:hypothetical protein